MYPCQYFPCKKYEFADFLYTNKQCAKFQWWISRPPFGLLVLAWRLYSDLKISILLSCVIIEFFRGLKISGKILSRRYAMIILLFDLQPHFKYMNYSMYTSHHFTPYGRYELNKLASLPMSGFIAQLVEHRTGIAEVTGSNSVEALIFSGFSPIA